VIKTTDGGTTWQLLDTKLKTKITGILVIDKMNAIFVTYEQVTGGTSGQIMKTTDGGATWKGLQTEGYPGLTSIRMIRPDFIVITGVQGMFLTSSDKLATIPQKIPVKTSQGTLANNFLSAQFSDKITGTLIGDNGFIIRTTDGGASWTPYVNDTNIVTAALDVIAGGDPNVLAIAGDYGTLLY